MKAPEKESAPGYEAEAQTSEEAPIITDDVSNGVNSSEQRDANHAVAVGVSKLFGDQVGKEIEAAAKETEEESYNYQPLPATDFPAPIRNEALIGLAGYVTTQICKGTEIKPEAVLAQFLAVFGNMLGRGMCKYQAGRHGTLINIAIVGDAARGAKGEAGDEVKRLIQEISRDFRFEKITKGHNSSEAIIAEICDACFGKSTEGEDILKDEEVPDKRLVIFEPELSRLLEVSNRGGSTISEFAREFYDLPEVIRASSRKSQLKATNPFISIVGHITPEGLRSSLRTVDAFNGLGSRLTFIASERTGVIPQPERADWSTKANQETVNRLKAILKHFRPNKACADNKEYEFRFTEEGSEAWDEVYQKLHDDTSGKSGLHSAILARSKPTVLRLSIIYAALDGQTEICKEHIDAAHAVWDYAAASALWAFGHTSGNPNSDKILKYLRRCGPQGSTRTRIQGIVFNGRLPSAELTEALAELKKSGFADFEKAGKKQTWKAMQYTKCENSQKIRTPNRSINLW
jgi:hypothetical protein